MFIKSIIITLLLLSSLNAIEIDNDGNVKCNPKDNIKKCFEIGDGKRISLLPGNYEVSMLQITKDNTTLIIPKGAILNLKQQDYPKKDGAIIGVYGKHKKWEKQYEQIKNVTIDLDGIIDGHKSYFIPKDISYEGINIKYGENCKIIGSGTIRNINGDGIDIDSSKYCLFRGKTGDERLKLLNNSGNGLHFGSPRPITGSYYNIVLDLYAEGNGYLHKRNGFDLSWPNPNGAIYINCIAKNNRKNWEIDGMGGQVIDSQSINTGKVKLEDTFCGASKAIVNGEDITNQNLVSKKSKILLKYYLKKILGIKTQNMLEGIKF